MACIVPKCSCTVLKKKQDKQNNRSLIAFGVNCSGCGHHSQLHRKFTSKDGLVIDELKAASSKQCCSLVPVSQLKSTALFNSFYSLIPMLYDSSVIQHEEVLCTCAGFLKDISSVLLYFNKFSYDEVTEELPSILCDKCTHSLINHQHLISKSDCFEITEHITLNTPTLVDVTSCDNHVTVCVVTRIDSNWSIVCERYPLIDESSTETQLSETRRKRRRREDINSVVNKNIVEKLKAAFSFKRHHSLPLDDLCGVPRSLTVADRNEAVLAVIGQQMCATVYSVSTAQQSSSIEKLQKIDYDISWLTIVVLTPSGCSLCTGYGDGTIGLYQAPFSTDGVSNRVPLSRHSIECCAWNDTGGFIFVGTEGGEIICYSFEDSAVAFNDQVCSGPVTALKWIKQLKSAAVGSADGRVYIVSVLSTSEKTPVPARKIKKCSKNSICVTAVLQGHKSFIGCLACSKDGNIVTGGWDGCIMTWTLPKEALTVAAENPELQDEPNTVFKTGTHTSVELLPSGIWNLDTNMLICLYRQQKEKTTLVFYC